MALETGVTYIDDLVDTNPPGTDTLDEADDHIRNIKTAVQGSFPSLGAAAVTKTAAEINAAVDVAQSTKLVLNTKIVNIGVWDMDADITVSVAHGLTQSKIRTVSILIFEDDLSTLYNFPQGGDLERVIVESADITMRRHPSGYFDGVNFDDGVINRGYITISYID